MTGPVLTTIAGDDPDVRLVVALGKRKDGSTALELREEHFAPGVGWFGQRALKVSPGQLRQLAAMVGPVLDEDLVVEERPATLPFRPEGPKRRGGGGGRRAAGL